MLPNNPKGCSEPFDTHGIKNYVMLDRKVPDTWGNSLLTEMIETKLCMTGRSAATGSFSDPRTYLFTHTQLSDNPGKQL
jgi:hypothetical protein